jgi:tubulin-specific chaperone D
MVYAIISREVDEVMAMISSVMEVSGEERRREQLLERWRYVLDLYQEQPHLLDPHLPAILGKAT